MDAKMYKKYGLITLGVAVAFMVLGLVLIGTVHTGAAGVNGFDAINMAGLGNILSNASGPGASQIQAGIVFAVILTPITAAIGLGLLGLGMTKNSKGSQNTTA